MRVVAIEKDWTLQVPWRFFKEVIRNMACCQGVVLVVENCRISTFPYEIIFVSIKLLCLEIQLINFIYSHVK